MAFLRGEKTQQSQISEQEIKENLFNFSGKNDVCVSCGFEFFTNLIYSFFCDAPT